MLRTLLDAAAIWHHLTVAGEALAWARRDMCAWDSPVCAAASCSIAMARIRNAQVVLDEWAASRGS